MADKIKALAEKLADKLLPDHWRKSGIESAERILRAELKPLLDAAQEALTYRSDYVRDDLAAELEGWATQRGGNSDT